MGDAIAGPSSAGSSGSGQPSTRAGSTGPAAAAKTATVETLNFQKSVQKELEVVNLRRRAKLPKTGAADATPARGPLAQLRTELLLASSSYSRGEPLTGADRLNLTGMCFSGGGIRSAAICLGVSQGLDSLFPPGRSDIIDRLDYLSTVSGGNYLGTSLAAGLTQQGGSFPFESKTDGAETPETRHLRDYSSYLVPNGLPDLLANLLAMIGGIVANLVMILPFLLFAAAITLFFYPDVTALAIPASLVLARRVVGGWPEALGGFVVSTTLAAILVSAMIFWILRKRWQGSSISLKGRERLNAVRLVMAAAMALAAFIEWQPAILLHMVQGPDMPAAAPVSTMSGAVTWVMGQLGQAGYVFAPAALGLLAFGQKLLNIIKATVGDASWAGRSKRYLSKAGLFLLGLSVPLLLWISYLNLSYWGICALVCDKSGYAAPDWIVHLGQSLNPDHPVQAFYLAVGLALFLISLLFSPNANSLHQLYRDRLSRAFLMERADVARRAATQTNWSDHDSMPVAQAIRMTVSEKHESLRAALANMNTPRRDSRQSAGMLPDDWTFSSLKQQVTGPSGKISYDSGAALAPYLLVNTAINLQATFLSQRGRKADTFTLGPLTCGSDTTGYVPTSAMEARDPRLTLGSGMAISGAAASANMGGNTIPLITFSLAALNIRLGYWLPNPMRINLFTRPSPPGTDRRRQSETGFAPWYLLRELFGWITDTSRRIHLTDGGHIENLGLYELLKRRCRVIIAVDAEADQGMTFPAFVKAQLLTRVDHGVRIELPWPRIAEAARAASQAIGTADETKVRRQSGPHVAVGRIIYRQKQDGVGADVHGVLIYIKSSMTGDENDNLRSYKRRFGDFPHETTLDQFFSEEQFEVYRALGFHMARGFFSGAHEAAFWTPDEPDTRADFFTDVENALTSIGVPGESITRILARAQDQADRDDAARRPPPPPRFVVQIKNPRPR